MSKSKEKFDMTIPGLQISWSDYNKHELEIIPLADILAGDTKVPVRFQWQHKNDSRYYELEFRDLNIVDNQADLLIIQFGGKEGWDEQKPVEWDDQRDGEWDATIETTYKIPLDDKNQPTGTIQYKNIHTGGEFEPLNKTDWRYFDESQVKYEIEKLLRTERYAMVKARIGQGYFRDKLMRRWGNQCCVTGCDIKEALRASHIIPWRTCNPEQKLSESNGLLLMAHLDALFDKYLISFNPENGEIYIPDEARKSLVDIGIHEHMKIRTDIPWPKDLKKNLTAHYEIAVNS